LNTSHLIISALALIIASWIVTALRIIWKAKKESRQIHIHRLLEAGEIDAIIKKSNDLYRINLQIRDDPAESIFCFIGKMRNYV
jgi:hypothetical protein